MSTKPNQLAVPTLEAASPSIRILSAHHIHPDNSSQMVYHPLLRATAQPTECGGHSDQVGVHSTCSLRLRGPRLVAGADLPGRVHTVPDAN